MNLKHLTWSFLAATLLYAGPASAATLNAVTSQPAAKVGDTITVSVMIDTEGAGVNAAQATLQYPTDLVEATGIDSAASVFNFWLEGPAYSNQSGRLAFTGGSTNGLNGHALTVLKVLFKVKKAGTADFSFATGVVTASDGSGANLLKGMHSAAVLISDAAAAPLEKPVQLVRKPVPAAQVPTKPNVLVQLYPNESEWYNVTSPFWVKWDLPLDISDVATALNQNPKSIPTKSEGLFDNKSFPALSDGAWYLHVRFKNNVGWSETAHYRIAVDTIPPSPFEIKSAEGRTTDTPNPTLTFTASDQLSGMAGYSARVDNGPELSAHEGTFTLPPLLPTKHTVRVYARDRAGNATDASIELTITPIASPTVSALPTDTFTAEGATTISGTSSQGNMILVRLLRENGETVERATSTVGADKNWHARLNYPLVKGRYLIEVVAQDNRGAVSLPVRTPFFTVRARPFLTVAGIELSETVFFLAIIFLLGLGFVFGIRIQYMQKIKRGMRVILSQRDVSSAFDQTRTDLSSALERFKGKRPSEREAEELRSIAKRVRDRMERVEKYILDNIEDINK